MSTKQTEVIIVGAGPTGLMAANQLGRFGIDYLILDRKQGPTPESRAIAVTARSLEIYQQLGIVDEVIKNGARVRTFHVFSNGKPKVNIPIGQIGKDLSEFHYLLGYEQSKNEELLYRHIQRQGKEVLWNTEFVRFQEQSDRVTVEARQGNETIQLEAKYLIAGDGASSPVRHQLDFSFSGGTYENRFIVADTLLDWDFDDRRVIIAPGRKNFFAFIPLYGKHNYRVIGTLPKQFAARDNIDFQDIEQIIRDTVKFRLAFKQVNWFSIYKLHHRCVDRFNTPRIYLAGDSAHIHSPAGGQGMNTGLQDAYNLCWKLAMVLRGTAQPSLLQTYNEERLPFARWLMKTTDQAFNLMTSDKWSAHLIRKYLLFNLMALFTRLSYTRKRIFRTVSQLWYSYHGKTLCASSSQQSLKFRAGDRLPYPGDAEPDKDFYKQFTTPGWHLLHIGPTPLDAHTNEQLRSLLPFPFTIVEQALTEAWQRQGVTQPLFILIRPDNYLSIISDSLEQLSSSFKNSHMAEYFKS